MDVDLGRYVSNPLWPILVETVHAMVMYPHHKAYTANSILSQQPDITPRDLATKLAIPLGEALVILHELRRGEDSSLDDVSV
ncbi:MAG: hypothetical protein ACE5NN_04815 [Candidatus Bathyarchaeia archaeon]